MEKNKNIFLSIGVVVAAVVISAIFLGSKADAPAPVQPVTINIDKVLQSQEVPSTSVGGQRGGLQEFTDGITPGLATEKWEQVTIGPGENQAYWTNDTGDTVYVNASDATIRYESGTASSSFLGYIATSSDISFTNYVRPSLSTILMDGALIGTSTTAVGGHQIFQGTTTDNGVVFSIPAGGRLIFDIQERYACKSVGACETATSSNRGITNFYGLFKWYKNP